MVSIIDYEWGMLLLLHRLSVVECLEWWLLVVDDGLVWYLISYPSIC